MSDNECILCETHEASKGSKFFKGAFLSAEFIDRLRIWPRGLISLYGYMCWDVLQWIKTLGEAATTQQVSIASIIWSGAAVWFAFFLNSEFRKKE